MAQIDIVGRRSAWAALKRRTQHGDTLFHGVTLFFALLVGGLVLIIAAVIWTGSAPARQQIGVWTFLTSSVWDPVVGRERLGVLAAIYGTAVSALIALLIAGPLGLFIGIFLAELCPRALRAPLAFLVELLAAIPSVIYGLWGALVLGPFLLGTVTQPLAAQLGAAFAVLRDPKPRNLLLAGLILAIMILPTIASISRDVLAVVPIYQREALLALGATRWEMIWQAVVPYARAGIIGGVMLGLGRALGETMAATMVIGNNLQIGPIVQPAQTTASLIATQLPSPNSDLHVSALILAALVLFGITLVLNALARLLVWQAGRGPAGKVRI